MNTINPKERLKQIYEDTITSGLKYDGTHDDIDFYSLLCKSTANNKLYKFFSCNLSMFNFKFENNDSILMIFSIPFNLNNDQENKHISERIIDILKTVEECFITIDYMELKSVKEDKFSYMVVIKKIRDEE